MGMGMFTPRSRSGLQVTLAATLLVLALGLAGAAAVTLSIWYATGAGATVMLAASAWFWRREAPKGDGSVDGVPRALPGFTNEAYAFTEWEATPAQDRESPSYPQNLAREVFEAPRVYAQPGEAPPPRPRHRRATPAPTRHWEPGAMPAPAAFRDASTGEDLVEFQVVNKSTTAPVTVAPGRTLPSLPEPDAPVTDFTRSVRDSRHAGFYEPAQKRYEKAELSEIMKARRERMTRDLPLVGGMLAEKPAPADPPESHPGKTRGKCSKCSTYLWAPAKRPLRVRCPKCGHEAKLN